MKETLLDLARQNYGLSKISKKQLKKKVNVRDAALAGSIDTLASLKTAIPLTLPWLNQLFDEKLLNARRKKYLLTAVSKTLGSSCEASYTKLKTELGAAWEQGNYIEFYSFSIAVPQKIQPVYREFVQKKYTHNRQGLEKFYGKFPGDPSPAFIHACYKYAAYSNGCTLQLPAELHVYFQGKQAKWSQRVSDSLAQDPKSCRSIARTEEPMVMDAE